MTRFCLTIVILWGTLCSPFVHAQDQANDSGRPPAVPVPGTLDDNPETPERIVYIPFKDLEGTFTDAGSDVILPYAVYRDLLEAHRASQQGTKPPGAVITKADYVATIDDELARIRATFTVNVLGKPWVELPVRFGEAAVGSVTGESVLLRGTGDGQYVLLFGKAGEQTVTFELATKVHQSPDGRNFVFECPPVAVSTLSVTVPKQDQTLDITPQVVSLPVDAGDEDVTKVRANVGATGKIAIAWHPKASLQPEMDLLTSVTNDTLVTVEDGMIHTDAYLTYDVLRGKLERFRIAIPANQRVLDVTSSSRIKSWKVNAAEGQQVVDIELLAAAEGQVTVEVHTERKLTDEVFDVAGMTDDGATQGIHALDAVRESGQLAIRHSADLSLTVVEQQGVVRIQPSEVRQRIAGNNALTYKFYSPNLTLKLSAKPVEPRLIVTHSVQEMFQDDELQFTSTLTYQVERAGVFELRISLPENVEIDRVECPQMKEYNVASDKLSLTIALRERTMGNISVVVRGHRTLTAMVESQNLPIIEPLNVERETGTIVVYAKESIEVITDQQGLVAAQPLPARGPGRLGNTVLNSTWSFTRRPVVIPVRTERKPTRLSSSVATTIDVQPELTQVRTQLIYNIEYSGIDTFRVEVPEAISDALRIELVPNDQGSSPIKQKTAAEPADGWVTWTIVTQREVLGQQKFLLTYDLRKDSEEPEEAEANEEEPTSIQVLRPLGNVDSAGEIVTPMTRAQGELAVVKEQTLSVSVDAQGAGIEAIDIRELTLLPQNGAVAYRYFKDDPQDRVTVTVEQMHHEIQEVVSTVVSRGLVEVVTDKDAEATYRCRFRIKTTERQRLLVQLPINLEVLGTFVNEREVKLEKAEVADAQQAGEMWAPYWVNVARTESSETPFLLTFQFLWKVKPALGESQYGRGRMTLPLPIIGNAGSVIQELKVVIWVPEEYALIGDPAQFDLQTRNEAFSLFLGESSASRTNDLEEWSTEGEAAPTGFVQFPTKGRVPYIYDNLGGAKSINVIWWNRLTMTMIFSIGLALIGWILVKTSWENKLGILLFAAFIAALYGLSDSHALRQGIMVARFGIGFTLALWLIHTLFGWTHATPVVAAANTTGTDKSAIQSVPYAVAPPPGVFDELKGKDKGTQEGDQ